MNRLAANERRSPHIEHVLIVSGPSAGGKSTLIGALAAGRLEEGVAGLLPRNAGGWPCVEGNDVLKRNLPLAAMLPQADSLPGVVVHYDIVHILRVGHSHDHRDDPLFDLLCMCDEVTVCDVRPTAARLLDQYAERLRDQQRRKGRLRLLWRRRIHAPLRRLRLRLRGQRHLEKDSIYRDLEWLAVCYRAWDDFLADVASKRSNMRIVRVEPAGAAGDDPQFRLCATDARPSGPT